MNKLTTQITLLLASSQAIELSVQETCSNDQADWATYLTPNPTDHGYTLEKACTSLSDDDCDCIPEGMMVWERSDCGKRGKRPCSPDTYFNSDEYQALDHDVKLEQLWSQLTEIDRSTGEVSPTKPKCQNFDLMWKHFAQSPGNSFNNDGDEMNNTKNETRNKLVHQQGLVATGKFEVDDTVVTDKGYTGIFASGSDSMLIRFSETGLHVDGITTSMNPSVAFKMLRSGTSSANQFGMIAFENTPAEGKEWDWFGKDLCNHLPNFKENETTQGCDHGGLDKTQVYSGECGPQTAGRWNSQSTQMIFANGNFRLAEYDQNGAPADPAPHYPFRVKFVAGDAVAGEGATATNGDSRFYKQLVEGGRAQIDKDIVLYTVWATEGIAEEYFQIGEIKTTSFFTPSLWGDERLFFQHGGLNLDFAGYYDDWRKDQRFRDIRADYEFNYDKYGHWNDPETFEIQPATESDVINGMASASGCPFAFLIDQINAYGARDPDFVPPE